MEQNITDLQKRRADNIIWNCAKDYSFAPDFKAYDSNGDVDIYWNIIFGSARRHYEYGKLEKLFAMLDKYRDSAFYENLFWHALEPVLFRTELSGRPVLERIRPAPVENCSMITMETRVLPDYWGWPWGRYALYAWGLDGQWQKLDYFQLEQAQSNGEPRTYDFVLPAPISFQALAVVLAEDGMDFTVWHDDTFYVDKTLVTAYSAEHPAPVFTPSTSEYPVNSAHVATSAYVNPYPAG